MLNTNTLSIYRLTQPDPDESGSFEYMRAFEDTGRIITGFMESAPPEVAAIVDGQFGKTFRFYSDDLEVDLAIGDRLVAGSNIYDVKGVQRSVNAPGRKVEIVLVQPIQP